LGSFPGLVLIKQVALVLFVFYLMEKSVEMTENWQTSMVLFGIILFSFSLFIKNNYEFFSG